ncbi:type IV secretion protein Rhs [Flavobacterium zepuense]|uniref:Type IV secretion protein Rhs n=1 Tax=Flavobacterium zepuense TaxID=2593302 RepID=A0A552UZI5_9FLAO|nr:DUF6443 domain-containing protein [Flavobacterium zepuense]TRW23602.1 type IV secretion protein Rhs [Flavobacterium zepuense]
MKNIIYMIFLLPLLAIGQTDTQNYVLTSTYRDPTTSSNSSLAKRDITYVDGLGRPIQKISGKGSSTGKDVITHIEYDTYGRQLKEYLPYVATTDNLFFDASARTSTLSYYTSSEYEDTSNPYSEQFVEASPNGRVLKQASPGDPWLGNPTTSNDHTVKYAYLTNTATEVKRLSANSTWNGTNKVYDISFVSNGNYAVGQLYKTITQDENKASAVYLGTTVGSKLNTTEEFKDKEGKLILKRTFNNNADASGAPSYEILDTYYVYDQFGNLSYVLPPLASGALVTELCYIYKYDARNRIIEKKIPGKQWEFIVYDSLDRVIAAGPVFSPFGGTNTGWIYSVYDAYNRLAYTGWYEASSANPTSITTATRKSLQELNNGTVVNATRGAGTIDGISTDYKPVTTLPAGFKLLLVNYYDDYAWPGAPAAPTASTVIEAQNALVNAKGMSTGSWVRTLIAPTSVIGEVNYVIYDKKARQIRSHSNNYLGGYTQINSNLDFDGTTLYITTKHKRSSSDQELSSSEYFTYNAQDMLVKHTHQIGSLATQLMSYNEYLPLGELKRKKVGGTDITGSTALQFVDYIYNARGWLISINNVVGLTSSTAPQDLFAFKINYNSAISTDVNGSVIPQYNGNIAETSWRTSSDNIQRRYGYKYDNLKRLTDAWYQIPQSSVQLRNSYNEHTKYDKNSNILNLVRNGELDNSSSVIETDNLAYTYHSTKKNQLVRVEDSVPGTYGFSDGSSTPTDEDFTYDEFGNLKTDLNKGITSIIYNHLHLPVTIQFGGTNKKITYLYDASGKKLQKVVTNTAVSPDPITTDYLSGYQYKNNVLEFFPTAEGYVKATTVNSVSYYNYVFNYLDHLGNVRVSYTVDPVDNVLKILEENHYYPFGLKHNGYNVNQNILDGRTTFPPVVLTPVINPGDITFKYKHNGKELQDELGLNIYDYGARNYDPAIGRWMNIDPKAETSRRFSPYVYALNNPVYFLDPDGMESEGWIEQIGEGGSATYTYNASVNTVAEAEAAGYAGATNVYGSVSVKANDNSYSFNLNENGSVTDKTNNYPYMGFNGSMTTNGGTTINTQSFQNTIDDNAYANWQKNAHGGITPMEFSSPIFNWGWAVKGVSGIFGALFTSEAAATTEAVLATESGIEQSRILGALGENAVGVGQKTRIPSLTGTAKYRIPDILTKSTLEEIKNVSHQSLTKQLVDFHLYSQEKNIQMILWTRANTTFSGPLQVLIDQGTIVNKIIP